jgi:hypothetical protein
VHTVQIFRFKLGLKRCDHEKGKQLQDEENMQNREEGIKLKASACKTKALSRPGFESWP